jgi:hypothetical protein
LSRIQNMRRRACRLSIAGSPPLWFTGASDTRSASHYTCVLVSRIAMQGHSHLQHQQLRGLRTASILELCQSL